jgi:UDP-N-acetylglucosamine diphosphorylase/glucosamine-1-phosphate N-acetyltransferase
MVLFEDACAGDFRPLTDLRSVADLLWGGRSLRERWAGLDVGAEHDSGAGVLAVNARLIAGEAVAERLRGLEAGTAIRSGKQWVAMRLSEGAAVLEGAAVRNGGAVDWAKAGEGLACEDWTEAPMLGSPNDLYSRLDVAIQEDLEAMIDSWGCVAGEKPGVWVAAGSEIEQAAVLDVRGGPIVLGPGATVQAGALLRGPVVIGAGSTVSMGTVIYGPTAIGPHCKVGGELNRVNMQGYSNKGHHGYLGDSVIGRWCNLGAGTTSSNLKNNYGEVKQWRNSTRELEPTGLQFCGLIMGDHSKCGIGTVFNTGTVIGTACVLFEVGFPPKHLPNFSWYNARTEERTPHELPKMLATAEHVMSRRGWVLGDEERLALTKLSE